MQYVECYVFFFSDFQGKWILQLALVLPTPHNMLVFLAKKIDRKIRQPQMVEAWRHAIKDQTVTFITSFLIISHWLHLNSKGNYGKIYCIAESFSSWTIA
jgi:hypothetical protein